MLDLGISIYNAEMFAALLGGGGAVDPVPDYLFKYKLDSTDSALTRQDGFNDFRIAPACPDAVGSWFGNTEGYYTSSDTALVAIGTGPSTLTFWVNTSSDTNQVVMASGLPNDGSVFRYRVNDQGRLQFNTNSNFQNSNGTIPRGVWVHVAITCVGSAGDVRFYIDGVLDGATGTTATYNWIDSGGLGIGARENGTQRLQGGLDDVRFYDRVLTPTEITDLSNYRCDFNPTQITTRFWQDAADISTITEAAGLVSQWNDKSGNGTHMLQAAGALQPSTGVNSLNGVNTIAFASDYMQSASPTTETIKAAFFVTNNLNGGANSANVSAIFSDNKGAGGVDNEFTFVRTNTDDYDISLDGASPTNSGQCSNNGGPLFSGGNISMGMTQAEKGTSTGNVFYTQYDTFDIEIEKIGDANTVEFLIGDIAEIIALDFVPTLELRQSIEGYLSWKWGTVDKLSIGHPYKNEPPKEQI